MKTATRIFGMLALSIAIVGHAQSWTPIPVTTGTSGTGSQVIYPVTTPISPGGISMHMGVIGDSICEVFGNAWQNEVIRRTGASLVYQDCRPGRQWQDALECYGATTPSGTVSSYNPLNPIVPYDTTVAAPPCGQFNLIASPQSGQTLAQNLAGVDVLIVALGTNDANEGSVPAHQPVGNMTNLLDPLNVNTQIGNEMWLMGQLHAANPAMHILVVTNMAHVWSPCCDTDALATAAAIVAVAHYWSDPVIDFTKTGNVNLLTMSTQTRDSVHPSDDSLIHTWAASIAAKLPSMW